MAIESTEENVRPSCLGVRHLQTALLAAAMMLQGITMWSTMTAIYHVIWRNEQHQGSDESAYDTLYSFFLWSFLIALIPAGELVTRFGGKRLLTLSLLVNVLIALVIPLIVDSFGFENLGWYLLCICFVLLGVSKSLVDPSMQNLIGQWIPLEEKGFLATIIYSGVVPSVFLSDIMTDHLESLFGWKSILYVNGVLGSAWTVAYIFLGSASPENSKFISKTELSYIQRSLRRVGVHQKYRTPYWKLMTSLPVWAVIVAHCGHVCGFAILRTLYLNIPSWFSESRYLPYQATFFLSYPMASTSDRIVRMNWLSVTKTRKLFNSIGLWVPAMILLFLAFFSLNEIAVFYLHVAALGITAGHYTGYLMVYTDLSPNYSANLIAITSLFGNLSLEVWDKIRHIQSDQMYFLRLLSSGIFFFSNLFFVIFASAERQPWNEPGTKHIVVPVDVVPVDVVPADVVPADVVLADVVPADVVLADVVPADVDAADVVPRGKAALQ